jgi:hypothetical protein
MDATLSDTTLSSHDLLKVVVHHYRVLTLLHQRQHYTEVGRITRDGVAAYQQRERVFVGRMRGFSFEKLLAADELLVRRLSST